MALIKTRPKVSVKIPREIRAGERFQALVVLDARRSVDVDFVDVVLTGHERWGVGSGNTATTRYLLLTRLHARLSGARELKKGRTELPVTFPLPPECPPSYRSSAAMIGYELEVHVAIPWWPDRRQSYEIHVAPPPVPSPPSEPQIYSSAPDGPRGTETHVELSLSSQWTRAGDIVTGAFALMNTASNRYKQVKLALVGTETLYTRGRVYSRREYLRYQIQVGVHEAEESEMIPFRFRLPDDAMAEMKQGTRPDGRVGLVGLEWQLELIAQVSWGSDLTITIPFPVLPRSTSQADAPSRLAPPTIGSDRLRSIWEDVGQPLGLRYRMQQLQRQLGETLLLLRREHQGRDGVHIVIELRYPELHLGLEVEPATRVQQVVGGGRQIGLEGWDRDHYVRGRDEEQIADVLRRIVPRLAHVKLRRMDDTHLLLQVRDSGQSRARLARYAAAAVELAQTFEEVRTDLPPPPKLAPALEEWTALAAQLGADLETARMRIEGQLSTIPAEVRVTFDDDGQPSRTWLSVEPASPIDEQYRFVLTSADEAPRDHIAQRFDGDAVAVVEALAHGAFELRIEPDRLAVCVPGPLGLEAGPPWIEVGSSPPPGRLDATHAERRLGRLARLASLLRGQAGPYR